MNFDEKALELHRANKGKIAVTPIVSLETMDDLAVAYTPGVGAVCKAVAANPALAAELTIQGRSVAVVTDGSAVLGLGNLGPKAAMPVMEGKAAIFKRFAGIDAYPICLGTQDTEEIIAAVRAISPGFAGINLEDISAPRCFAIEERLVAALDIPVLHDDQHGTAVVVLAGLMNALTVTGRDITTARIVIVGAGAAGLATASLLRHAGAMDIRVCDSKGLLLRGRADMNVYKEKFARDAAEFPGGGDLAAALKDADVFIGLSGPRVLTAEMVRIMAANPIVFALSNPVPEIMPDEARDGGAAVIATGRSDYANQLNNALVFPGLFRGAIDAGLRKFTPDILLAVARALAARVEAPTAERVLPGIFDAGLAESVAQAVRDAA